MPQGIARIIQEGDIPLSSDIDEDEQLREQQQQQRQQANIPEQQQPAQQEPRRQLHPDEEYEQELAAQGQQLQQEDEEDDEPEARMDDTGKSTILLTPAPFLGSCRTSALYPTYACKLPVYFQHTLQLQPV